MTNNQEDYLKIIFKLQESGKLVNNKSISSLMGISPASVSEMLKKLVKDHLVIIHKNEVKLTDEAVEYTKNLMSKHRLWETFLLTKLNYTWQDVHELAERLEHVTDDSLKDKLNEFLNFPIYCPHGSIIYENLREESGEVIPMMALKIGDMARIVRVHSDNSLLSYLDRLGLNILSEFTVTDRDLFDDSMQIEYNGQIISISAKALPAIYVNKLS